MGTTATPRPRRQTRDVQRSEWLAFLTQFTRENRGAHARLEIIGPESGHQVETDDRPFEGAAADIKDNESAVWITLGTSPSDHLTHGIHNVTAIRALEPEGEAGAVLEVESTDGTKTIVALSPAQAYALPPAPRDERRS